MTTPTKNSLLRMNTTTPWQYTADTDTVLRLTTRSSMLTTFMIPKALRLVATGTGSGLDPGDM